MSPGAAMTGRSTAEESAGRPPWIERLLDPRSYPHPAGPVRLVETHISWVFLTGPFAYKVKKPVRLDFVDFSTPALRRHFCLEEVRLSGRFAPELYLGVVPILGPEAAPRVGSGSEAPAGHAVLEWAVKLVQFDEGDRLDARFDAGRLSAADCRAIGERIADVQAGLAIADPAFGYGTPERLRAVFAMNLAEIRRHRPDTAARVDALASWLDDRVARDRDAFLARVRQGRIRECHGDLHLANVVLLAGRPVAFDSIEFNPDLRLIDVASDVAFLTMDLESRGRPDLAAHVTSAWMEAADDHAAAAVLPVHRVARALVRAAVAAIRAAQPDCPAVAAEAARRDTDRYLGLAAGLTEPRRPVMLAVTGVSGSGKSTLALHAVGRASAVRLRSDVERKRLAGMRPTDRPGGDAAAAELYSHQATDGVYRRLATLARGLLAAGTSVVVDATGNTRRQRAVLAEAARAAGAPLAWLEIDLPPETVLERVAARARGGDDPSDAGPDVVRRQFVEREPIGPAETDPAGVPPVIRVPVAAAELDSPEALLDRVLASLRAVAFRENPR